MLPLSDTLYTKTAHRTHNAPALHHPKIKLPHKSHNTASKI